MYIAGPNGALFALDKADGALLAYYEVGESLGFKAPAVANGVVFIVAKDRSLNAVRMSQ